MEEGTYLPEPVSPTGLYLNNPIISVSNIAVLESEIPIDDSETMSLLKNVFLPINPRFSCIMITDKKGIKRWKKVEIDPYEHLKLPTFPPGMPVEYYDQCFEDYLTNIGMESLDQNRPLWEIHIFKYPTSDAAGCLILKISHSIGDGYSLMSALFSSFQRADNPSLPLTFPNIKIRTSLMDEYKGNILKAVPKMFASVFYTASDFLGTFAKSSFAKDAKTPIRHGEDGVEFRPLVISTTTLSLDRIKQIKDKQGLTLNDVITGIVFLGTRYYMKAMSKDSIDSNSTALVILNTRMFRTYTSIKDMIESDARGVKSPWGNHFTFLDVAVPKLSEIESMPPLQFLDTVHEIIMKKRTSFAVHLTSHLLEFLRKVRGPEAATKHIKNTLKNTSMSVINLVGPVEQMALANHPGKGLYYMVTRGPQSLTVGIISYVDKLRIAIGGEKDFIDTKKFKSCIQEAFEVIFNAACPEIASNSQSN